MLTGDFWGGFLGSRSSHLVPSHHRWRTCAQVHDHLMQYLVPPLPLFEFLFPPPFPVILQSSQIFHALDRPLSSLYGGDPRRSFLIQGRGSQGCGLRGDL